MAAVDDLGTSPGPVLLADADAASRAEVVEVLATAGYAVVDVSSGLEAIEKARELLPSIVLLEVPLEDVSGYEVCRALREEHGEAIPIMFVSATRTKPYDRVAGLLLGANDYVVKPYAHDELVTRMRNLIRLARPLSSTLRARLTNRESEVLRLLADGHDPKEIAERLFISRKTVASHIENIRRKLGVRSRTQAVALAYRESLVGVVDGPT